MAKRPTDTGRTPNPGRSDKPRAPGQGKFTDLLERIADLMSRSPDAMAGAIINGLGRSGRTFGLAGVEAGTGEPTATPNLSGDPAVDRGWKTIFPLFRRVLEKQDRSFQVASFDRAASTRKFARGDAAFATPSFPRGPRPGFDAHGIGTGRHSFGSIISAAAHAAATTALGGYGIGNRRRRAIGEAVGHAASTVRNAAYTAHGHARYAAAGLGNFLERQIDAVWAAPGRAWGAATRFGGGIPKHFTPQAARRRNRAFKQGVVGFRRGFRAAVGAHTPMRGQGPFGRPTKQAAARFAKVRAAGATRTGLAGASIKAGIALGSLAGIAMRVAGPISQVATAGFQVYNRAHEYAEHRFASNRRFAGLNPTLALAYAHADRRELWREAEIGRMNQSTTLELVRSTDRMRESFKEIQGFGDAIKNRVAIFGANAVAQVNDGIVAPILKEMRHGIDKADPGGQNAGQAGMNAGENMTWAFWRFFAGKDVANEAVAQLRQNANQAGVLLPHDVWANDLRKIAGAGPFINPRIVPPPPGMGP